MDVTPMNLQMVVPRSADAAQLQQNMNHAAAMQQDMEMVRQKEDDKLKQQQVRTKDETEDGRIKDDPERDKRQGGWQMSQNRRQNAEAEEEEGEKYAIDPARGRFFDASF